MSAAETMSGSGDLRVLVVMRHGEAEPHSASGDEGRELTSAGWDAARAAGRWLVSQGVAPDVALVSTATRTRRTWEALDAGGVQAGDVRYDRALYNGSVADLVEAIGTVPDTARVVLLVGHSPSVPELATGADVRCELPSGWSPATLGVISHPGSWEDFPGPGTALVACHPS